MVMIIAELGVGLHDFEEYLIRLRHELQLAVPIRASMTPGVYRVSKQTQGQTLIPAGHEFTGQRLARLVFAGATQSLELYWISSLGPEVLDRVDDAGVKVALRLLTCKTMNAFYIIFSGIQSQLWKC
jgi:hypothetical protein